MNKNRVLSLTIAILVTVMFVSIVIAMVYGLREFTESFSALSAVLTFNASLYHGIALWLLILSLFFGSYVVCRGDKAEYSTMIIYKEQQNTPYFSAG